MKETKKFKENAEKKENTKRKGCTENVHLASDILFLCFELSVVFYDRRYSCGVFHSKFMRQ